MIFVCFFLSFLAHICARFIFFLNSKHIYMQLKEWIWSKWSSVGMQKSHLFLYSSGEKYSHLTTEWMNFAWSCPNRVKKDWKPTGFKMISEGNIYLNFSTHPSTEKLSPVVCFLKYQETEQLSNPISLSCL